MAGRPSYWDSLALRVHLGSTEFQISVATSVLNILWLLSIQNVLSLIVLHTREWTGKSAWKHECECVCTCVIPRKRSRRRPTCGTLQSLFTNRTLFCWPSENVHKPSSPMNTCRRRQIPSQSLVVGCRQFSPITSPSRHVLLLLSTTLLCTHSSLLLFFLFLYPYPTCINFHPH